MKKIDKSDWVPSDGLKLEDNALSVVKSDYNSLVVAGPGAGKTELLAQRACYLLKTNECKYPRKILAISFKADAATNLKDRVILRCGNDLSKRFDSMTFDAFAKGLFDRFKSALPEKYHVNNPYQVGLTDSPVLDEFKSRDVDYFNTNKPKHILEKFYAEQPVVISNDEEKLAHEVWLALLSKPKPIIPFKMIMRLAQLIINTNPLIKKFLQHTYQFVFLDEFQDTTTIQYDFLRSCFFQSNTIFTAVGDDKQRIMIWAGAKEDAFKAFEKDVAAKEIPLFMNFRSAPRLVALQNYLVKNLLNKPEEATPATHWDEKDGECKVWVFDSPAKEMEYLLKVIKDWIDKDGLDPREICILVKQQLKVYAGDLIEYFNQNGIKSRDETEIQNLLSEDLVVFLLNFLYSAMSTSYSKQKLEANAFLQSIFEYNSETDLLNLEIATAKLQMKFQAALNRKDLVADDIKRIVDEILDFIGIDKLQSTFPTYKDNAYFVYLIENFVKLLFAEYDRTKDALSALDSVSGKNTIPVMTVHKSKGLEYHSVIFVGLEDGAFWSYKSQADEDKCTFFVALSRAKNRVIFTFSKMRPDRYNQLRPQKITDIQEILEGLNSSGIATLEAIQ